MKLPFSTRQSLVIILWLVAFHSFCVGLGLIFLPSSMMPLFGFHEYTFNFFPIQGGVFHLVMVVVYLMGAINPEKNQCCISLAVIAKTIAFFFLIIYFLFIESINAVLLSGISDGIMGLVIFFILRAYRRTIKA